MWVCKFPLIAQDKIE